MNSDPDMLKWKGEIQTIKADMKSFNSSDESFYQSVNLFFIEYIFQ